MYTIYAFGNGYILFYIFQSIALFFKNNNIGVLFTILALIAAIYYAAKVTIYHQHSLVSTAKYILAFTIILTGLVYNQTTVIVNDVANPGAPTNAQPISNVPWGIAVLWSDFTTIQYGLAKDFTNDFSVPAGDNMLSEGLGVSIIQQADSATISTSNSYLYQDYNQYISNCVAPGVESGNLNASSLLSAGDATNTASATYQPNNAASIWQIMSSYTSNTGAGGGGNMLTEWYSGTGANSTTFEASGATYQNGTSTTCAQETTWLQTAVQDYINQVAGPAIAGGEGFANSADYDNSLGTMNSFLLNVQQSGQNQLFQAIGVNMYAPAILKMAQVAGVNANGLAYATGTAENSTNSSMFISGILAGKYMPIVFGLFEAIVLIASVIILILIATHMGLKYVKLLFEIMLMITIWPSLTAGFNYVTQLIIQAQYATYSGIGYSVSGSGGITNYFDSALSWMGYLSWSVPMMAYAIASGSSYAMTSMVSGLSSGLRTNSATDALSKGNASFGVMSGDNMNMNKFDVVHTNNTGWAPKTNQAGFTKTSTAGGITDIQKNIPGISDSAQIQGSGAGTFNDHALGLNQTFAGGQLSSIAGSAISASETQSTMAGITKNLTNAKSEARTAATNLNAAVTNSRNFSSSVGSNLTGSQRQNYDAVATKNFDYIVDHSSSLTAAQQDSLKTQFSAGISAGESPVSAGFSAISSTDISGTAKASLDDKFASVMKTSFSKKGELSYVAQGTQGTQLVNSLVDVITSGKSYQKAESSVKSAQSQLSYAQNNQAAVTESTMWNFFKDYDQKFGAGMNIEQLKDLNKAEYANLLQNSAPLEEFAANNPKFTNTLNTINAGANLIPGVNSAAAKKGVTGLYGSHIPTYSAIAGTPTPASVKSEINVMNTKPKAPITVESGGHVQMENPLLYEAGYVYNFAATGLTDVVRLMQGKGHEHWSVGSYKPTPASVSNSISIPDNPINQKIKAFDASLAHKKLEINSSLLPGSNGASGSYFNDYNNSGPAQAGASVIKSVDNLGLNPGDSKFPEPKSITPPFRTGLVGNDKITNG